ncbi:MAG: M48 family metalloprotease [Kiloniellales bacterium]
MPRSHRVTAILSLFAAALISALLLVVAAQKVSAQSRQISFIRDTEIEDIIRELARPIFIAAHLDPNAVNVYLVQDRSLNAFVAGGQNLFLNTGLLARVDSPETLLGVVAHEAGHIAGGHLAQRKIAVEDAGTANLIAYAVGILGAIASGRGEVASAVISGSSDLTLRNLLSYSRSNEQAADQAAVQYLHESGISPEGLLDFMSQLKGQEVLLARNQDPYLSTHPLTRERITFLENQVAQSPFRDKTSITPTDRARFERARAKVIGFLESPNMVARTYADSDQSVPARYARVLLAYRLGHLEDALRGLDSLLAEVPNDPFFLELKGQMLFERGHVAESLDPLQRAVTALPQATQIRQLLARAQIEQNSPELDRKAVANLEKVLARDPTNAFAWRLIATPYNRLGKTDMVHLALSEYWLARGDNERAGIEARRAMDLMPAGSPDAQQAQDVYNEAERRLRAAR